MANFPKDKGTKWETECVKRLRELGFEAGRTTPGVKSWDIQNVPASRGTRHQKHWVIECKWTKKAELWKWVPRARAADLAYIEGADGEERAEENPHWVILWKHGDGRTQAGMAMKELAILDLSTFMDMLKVYEEYGPSEDPQ